MGFSPEQSASTHGKFRRGIDRQQVASGATLIWSVVIPPSPTISILLHRIIKAYEGGSIVYRVWTKQPGASVTYSATPINVLSANSLVQFRRVTAWDNTGAVLSDIDEVPNTGTGNAAGEQASVESMRVQPPGAEFILVATNESNATRTLTLNLQWCEVNAIAELNDEV